NAAATCRQGARTVFTTTCPGCDPATPSARPAGENTSLAVFTTPEAQLGNVAYQMQVQVAALGRALASPARRQDAPARS
ncbi:hypothetical protein ACWC5I_10130, partial [Kitasatospora sp. NPDC001574]